MIPLLVFASQWGFSFEHGSQNTEVGSVTQGVVTDVSAEDSIAMKVQSAVVYLSCAFLMVRFIGAIAAGFYSDPLIISLPVLAFLSIAWSQFPMTSLVHAVMLGANMAFAFYLLERFSPNDLLRILLMVGALAAIGSMFLIICLPQYGVQNRSALVTGAWQGIFGQKNICGLVMTDLLLPAFFVEVETRRARVFRISYIALVLAIIAMSHSVGAWVVCAACIAFVLAMRLLVRMPQNEILAIVFIWAGFALIAGILVYRNFDLLMYALGKDPTLTGRTRMWSSLLSSVMKNPMLGYGYAAFWGGLQGESANITLVEHGGIGYAENGVLELCLELGVLGVVLYLLVFFRAIKNAAFCFMRKPSPAVMWYISSLFFIAVSNIEGGKLLSTSDLGFILSIVAFVGLRREAQRARFRTNHDLQVQNLTLIEAR
jgi:exopolysaccharide production protein ExoQ